MAIELNPIGNPEKVGGFNTNFTLIEEELNNNVLRRKGLDEGEPNYLEVDIDMNGHSLLNVNTDLADSGSIVSLGDADFRYVKRTGSSMTGNLAMSGNDISGVGTTSTEKLILDGFPVSPDLDINRVIWVDTIADLQALPTSGLVDGQAADIKGSSFVWDNASSQWTARGVTSVRAFGAVLDGVTDDTLEFEACANHPGVTSILIDGDSISLSTSGVDANGKPVKGNNTTVAGYIKNASILKGIKIGGISQSLEATHPGVGHDTSNKLISRDSANKYFAFSQSERGGYVLNVLVNNITTTNDSLASTASDQTQWRINGMLRCVEVLTGYLTASASNGTWSSNSLTTGVPAHTSGSFYNYTTSSDIGAWKEFTITVPEDGFFSVTFLMSPSASPNVDVLVDGVVIESGIDLTSASAKRLVKKYTTEPGSRVVRLENKHTESSSLHIVGVNFSPLKTQRMGVDVDTYGYYRNNSFSDPLNSNSANDYAIFDNDASLWGGSYHGGESGFTETFYADSATLSLSTGDIAVCQQLEIEQSSTIDWSLSGGAVIDVETRHFFLVGGYAFTVNLTGAVNARDYFTTLWGVSTDYQHLSSPEKLDISTLTDLSRHPLPYGNSVEFRSASNDRLKIDHSTYNYSQIKEGGPFVWRVVGSYHKYYNAIVTSGIRTVDKVYSVLRVSLT